MDTTEDTIRKRGRKPGARGRKPTERVKRLFNPRPNWQPADPAPSGRESQPVRMSAARDVAAEDSCPAKAAAIEAILARRGGGAR